MKDENYKAKNRQSTPSENQSLARLKLLLERLEINARINAKTGKKIQPLLNEWESECRAVISNINNDAQLVLNGLEHELKTCKSKMAIPKKDRIDKMMRRLEPAKVEVLAKVRAKTTDKNPAFIEKIKELQEEKARLVAEADCMLANDYNGKTPNRHFYDNRFGYIGLLLVFGMIEWQFSRDALSNFGGFERAAAAFISIVMGIAMSLSTHNFGHHWQRGNTLHKKAFGFAGAVLVIIIIVLRINFKL